jgi:hypothetical protein
MAGGLETCEPHSDELKERWWRSEVFDGLGRRLALLFVFRIFLTHEHPLRHGVTESLDLFPEFSLISEDAL